MLNLKSPSVKFGVRCATTGGQHDSVGRMAATFADHAKDAGVVFEVQKGEARSTGEAGTLLQVYGNDYRMAGIGSRNSSWGQQTLDRQFRQMIRRRKAEYLSVEGQLRL
jgi:hypothetical protein